MTTAAAEAPATPPTPTPVEWVKSLPVEDREAVFLELLREVMAVNGTRGRIDIETESEEYLGYFVPAEAERAEVERLFPHDPVWEAELDRRRRESTPIPIQQMVAELRVEAARLAELPETPGPRRDDPSTALPIGESV